jgi:hypothetical protein
LGTPNNDTDLARVNAAVQGLRCLASLGNCDSRIGLTAASFVQLLERLALP